MDSCFYYVQHATRYQYSAPVSLAQQLAHLWPRVQPYQQCLMRSLEVSPTPCLRVDAEDVFGNPITRLSFECPHEALVISARLSVAVFPRPLPELNLSPAWEQVASSMTYQARALDASTLDAVRFRVESPYVRIKEVFVSFAADCFLPGQPFWSSVAALMRKIYQEFTYDNQATLVATPLLEVLKNRRGVCQDFAHLMLACLRARGFAARYVSGYLLTHPPAGASRMIGADASHAWISVYCPGQGWVDFDPTNNLLPNLEHISLAWGRDFGDVSPLRGVILGGGAHEPEVQVTVLPLSDAQNRGMLQC